MTRFSSNESPAGDLGVRRRPGRAAERGVALMLVLGFLAVAALLIVHLATLSQVSALESHSQTTRRRLRYAAESAAELACWRTLIFRSRHPGILPGVAGGALTDLDPEDVWLADGAPHVMPAGENERMVVRVFDADSGLDLSGPSPGARLKRLPAFQQLNDEEDAGLAQFLDTLDDYVDPDDFVRLHGKERDDYAAEGWPDMPRNRPMQMREEGFWIEGIATVFGGSPRDGDAGGAAARIRIDDLRVIPPRGVAFKRQTKPSLFSASPSLIRALLSDVTDSDIALIRDAIREWYTNRTPLSQSLPPDLFARLRARFSFTESGVVRIQVAAESGEVRFRFTLVRDIRTTALRYNAGAPWLQNWEVRMF